MRCILWNETNVAREPVRVDADIVAWFNVVDVRADVSYDPADFVSHDDAALLYRELTLRR